MKDQASPQLTAAIMEVVNNQLRDAKGAETPLGLVQVNRQGNVRSKTAQQSVLRTR